MSQISPKNKKAKVLMDEKLTTIFYFDINNKEHQKLKIEQKRQEILR